jgi:hypothetical protein
MKLGLMPPGEPHESKCPVSIAATEIAFNFKNLFLECT